ncbi:MAG: lipoate--protein ligase family protein [bacterium]|nr:lipoate--protein ligase family protein [bacterium]
MFFLDLSFPILEQNLAFEEAWLQAAEQGLCGEGLRLWDAAEAFIVLGRGSKVAEEVYLERAAQDHVSVLRRVSGGATVMASRGCMFYAVLLSLQKRPHLRMLDQAHGYVMDRLLSALRPYQPGLEFAGTSDLVVGGKKVSGNSLRVTRDWLLYHGTLLLNMELSLVSKYLRHPPREPGYRQGREHAAFIENLDIDRAVVANALRKTWEASETAEDLPNDLEASMRQLVEDKYSQESWNLGR